MEVFGDEVYGDELEGDGDVVGVDFGGLARHVFMPHTLITDRFHRGGGQRQLPARRPTGPAMARGPHGTAIYARPPLPAELPNIPSQLGVPIGVGVASWANTNTDTIDLEVEPQVNFAPKRLIIDVAASGATAAIVVVRNITVGVTPQLPATSQPIPASLFAKDATVSAVAFQVVKAGIKFTVTLGVTAAPGSGVTITAACGAYGKIVR